MKRFVAIGEAMIELANEGADLYRLGVAGDTLNTAWYLRRALGSDWQVDYMTRVGTDHFSDRITAFIADAGIRTAHIGRDPNRGPGLYAISLSDGERSFSYWRETSAARGLADDPTALDNAISGADAVYFSGITLAILPADRRAVLLDRIAASGALTVFDPNIRPRLWETPAAARDWITRAAAISGVVLPSADDEATCFGDTSPAETLKRYVGLGVPEVVVKNAGGDVQYHHDAQGVITGLPCADPVDTTGAGDSFNAAYLTARLTGSDVPDAIRAGHKLAMSVVGGHGALVPNPC